MKSESYYKQIEKRQQEKTHHNTQLLSLGLMMQIWKFIVF